MTRLAILLWLLSLGTAQAADVQRVDIIEANHSLAPGRVVWVWYRLEVVNKERRYCPLGASASLKTVYPTRDWLTGLWALDVRDGGDVRRIESTLFIDEWKPCCE